MKKITGLLSFILLAGLGHSQNKKSPVKTETIHTRKGDITATYRGKTLLWEISGNGLKHPSYLFGTMHILCADDARLSSNLKSIIKDSKEIYFEIDMDNMAELMGAMKYLRMNDGVKISDLLTSAEYERVKDYFEKNKAILPFSMMNRFKPYFVSSLIGEKMMTCEKKNGMEELIMRESKQYEKPIKGLETTEFQASIFDSIPYNKQAKDLLAYIDSIDNYRQITHEMIDVYRDQDLERMDALMKKSDPGMESYMDLLLYNRNRRWVKLMPSIMQEGSFLFAVGAGHLPGDQGVIKLLLRNGYTVRPVENSN
ncbi:MAG: TraB/GumN family protein [Chitinophagaceae bacterium]|nr:TraB/GumN family protein [Chitinophagaceae bacterium]